MPLSEEQEKERHEALQQPHPPRTWFPHAWHNNIPFQIRRDWELDSILRQQYCTKSDFETIYRLKVLYPNKIIQLQYEIMRYMQHLNPPDIFPRFVQAAENSLPWNVSQTALLKDLKEKNPATTMANIKQIQSKMSYLYQLEHLLKLSAFSWYMTLDIQHPPPVFRFKFVYSTMSVWLYKALRGNIDHYHDTTVTSLVNQIVLPSQEKSEYRFDGVIKIMLELINAHDAVHFSFEIATLNYADYAKFKWTRLQAAILKFLTECKLAGRQVTGSCDIIILAAGEHSIVGESEISKKKLSYVQYAEATESADRMTAMGVFVIPDFVE